MTKEEVKIKQIEDIKEISTNMFEAFCLIDKKDITVEMAILLNENKIPLASLLEFSKTLVTNIKLTNEIKTK